MENDTSGIKYSGADSPWMSRDRSDGIGTSPDLHPQGFPFLSWDRLGPSPAGRSRARRGCLRVSPKGQAASRSGRWWSARPTELDTKEGPLRWARKIPVSKARNFLQTAVLLPKRRKRVGVGPSLGVSMRTQSGLIRQ